MSDLSNLSLHEASESSEASPTDSTGSGPAGVLGGHPPTRRVVSAGGAPGAADSPDDPAVAPGERVVEPAVVDDDLWQAGQAPPSVIGGGTGRTNTPQRRPAGA